MYSNGSHKHLLITVGDVVKSVADVTPKTTTDDVIHALLTDMKHPAPHEAVDDYALFENIHGVERPLKARSNFMKLRQEQGSVKVELTLRKIDSAIKHQILGSSSKKKSKYKNWFKRKRTCSVTEIKPIMTPAVDIGSAYVADQTDVFDDSSIIMQNKENLLCAFNCYSKKKTPKGLKDRKSNAPFERPLSVMTAPEMPRSIALQMMSKQQQRQTQQLSLPQQQIPLPTQKFLVDSAVRNEHPATRNSTYNKAAITAHPSVQMASAQYVSGANVRRSASVVQGLADSLKEKRMHHQKSVPLLRNDTCDYGTGSLRKAGLTKSQGRVYGSAAALTKPAGDAYGSVVPRSKDTLSKYGSTVVLSQDREYGSTVTLQSDVYGSTANLKKLQTSRYPSAGSLQSDNGHCNYQTIDPVYSRTRDPYTSENLYDCLQPLKAPRSLPQNPIDWDYDLPSDGSQEDSDDEESQPDSRGSNPCSNGQFNQLLNVVLLQEKEIQEQLHRIKKADEHIEEFEIKLHTSRSKEQGKDYLQATYLKDGLKEEEVNLYESIVEGITQMDKKLAKQYSKIEDLSSMIYNESQLQMNETDITGIGPFESTRIDPSIQKQLEGLRQQIQDTVNMSVARDAEIKELDNCLNSYEQQLKEKEDQLKTLLDDADDCDSNQRTPLVKLVTPLNTDKLSRELYQSANKIRSLISSTSKKSAESTVQRCYNEIGIDAGDKQSCDNGKQWTPRSKWMTPGTTTPLGESVNAILEYHNETVDLDALCNGGKQNPVKLSNVEVQFKPSSQTTVQPTDDKHNFHRATEETNSTERKLPLVGVESVAKVLSSKLMPDLTAMDPESYRLTIDDLDSDLDTTIWNSQDDGIDVTFVTHDHRAVTIDNTYFLSPNKTLGVFDSTATSESGGCVLAARPPRHNTQTTSQKTRAKKKLFQEAMTSRCPEVVQQEIRNLTSAVTGENSCSISLTGEKRSSVEEKCSLTGENSSLTKDKCSLTGENRSLTKDKRSFNGDNCSRLSESSESGVGSLLSGEEGPINDVSPDVTGDSAVSSCGVASFVETAV